MERTVVGASFLSGTFGLELHWLLPLAADPEDSIVLARAAESPVLVYRPLGDNGVLWQGTDELWRLRERPDRIWEDSVFELVGLLTGWSRDGTVRAVEDRRTAFDLRSLERLCDSGLCFDCSDTARPEIGKAVDAILARLGPVTRTVRTRPVPFPVLLTLALAALVALWICRRDP